MAKPQRTKKTPTKPTKTDNSPKSLEEKMATEASSTPEIEEVTAVELIESNEETAAVDSDAAIQALKDAHKQEIDGLKKAMAEAEKNAGSANTGSEEFKTRPSAEDVENGIKYFYFEIIWHPKRSDADEETVPLGVNGKILQWQRNVPVVIRSDYLEVADNAFVPKFKQLPGEDRKEIGGLKPFTYTINRKISQEEYLDRKKSGNKALQDDLQNKGIAAK